MVRFKLLLFFLNPDWRVINGGGDYFHQVYISFAHSHSKPALELTTPDNCASSYSYYSINLCLEGESLYEKISDV